MTDIDKFEQSLNNATEIFFHLTRDYNKEPTAVKLGFDNPQDGIIGYSGIHSIFKNLEITLVIFTDDSDTLDISIVSKATADALNVKNLKYNKQNLVDYLESEPTDRRFIVLIGGNPPSEFDVALPEGMTQPIVFDKYSKHQRP